MTIEVGLTAWQMAEWEIHALRGLVAALKNQVALHERAHKADVHREVPTQKCEDLTFVCREALVHFEHNRRRALLHPALRRTHVPPPPVQDAPECPPIAP